MTFLCNCILKLMLSAPHLTQEDCVCCTTAAALNAISFYDLLASLCAACCNVKFRRCFYLFATSSFNIFMHFENFAHFLCLRIPTQLVAPRPPKLRLILMQAQHCCWLRWPAPNMLNGKRNITQSTSSTQERSNVAIAVSEKYQRPFIRENTIPNNLLLQD